MPFSLIHDAWLPVRRAGSGVAFIRPAQITENIQNDPVIAIDWPRADFRLASLEFLIGLLATACPARDRREWPTLFETPPTPEMLDAAFAPLAFAFELDGSGPRFMQDFEDFAAKPNDIANLLIESPGETTLEKNTDLLNKRGKVNRLSRASAAMALFTLQTYAPAGGAGNRTGLRGGGPLTTLVVPPGPAPLSLWHLLWANVPNGEPVVASELAHIFPWLTKTRTSEDNKKVAPDSETYDRLAFWGTPRRIRLDFTLAVEGDVCDLMDTADSVVVMSWRQRPNGANYEKFEHPLTPYYNPKPKEQMLLPVHPQPGGIGYRHFLGLVFAPAESSVSLKPAAIVSLYRNQRYDRESQSWRLLAAGYDMDNMKARSFIEAELPVFEAQTTEQMQLHDEILRGLIEGADEVASLLRQAVRSALFSEGAKPDINAGLFSNLKAQFWQQTETAFYQQAQQSAAGTARKAVSQEFLRHLRAIALRLFDEAVPITGSDHPGRVAQAAKWFGLALHGYGKSGAALYSSLGLEAQEVKPKTKRKLA